MPDEPGDVPRAAPAPMEASFEAHLKEVLHALHVYRIKLEAQNREMVHLRKEAEAVRDILLSSIQDAPLAIAMFDREMLYIAASRRWKEDYLLGSGDIVGKSHYEIFPEIPERWKEFHRRGLAGAVVSADEDRFERGNGRIQWLRWELRPWYASDGTVGGIVIFTEDITARKLMERELAENRHLLELALSGSELGVWDLELATQRASFDERYCSILGFSVDEFGKTKEAWHSRVHPEDRNLVDRAVAMHRSGETRLYEAEYRLRHREGHWIWVMSRGKVTYDAEGCQVRMTGTLQNVSSRKRIAAEGAELLKRVESLIFGLDRGVSKAPGGSNQSTLSKIRLSGRNREVLQLVAEGATTAQIARELGISEGTAATHRRNLMRKLNVRNKAELIRYAWLHKIITP